MNFLMIFNMFKSTHNLPSYLFRNRMFSTQIKFFKKIFNFMGFTYRNNAWYIENINNLLNYFSTDRLISYFFKMIQFFVFIWLIKENINGSLLCFWSSIEFMDEFISGSIYMVYFLIIFIKITVYNFLFNKKLNYRDNLNIDKDEMGLDFIYDKFFKFYNFLNFNDSSTNDKNNNKLFVNAYSCTKVPTSVIEKKNLDFYKFFFNNETADNMKNIRFTYNIENLNIKFINVIYDKFNIEKYSFFFNNYSSYYNFKNTKYNKWLFNYLNLNSNNYSQLYSLNRKFNKLDLSNLYNLNKNFNFITADRFDVLGNSKLSLYWTKGNYFSFFNFFLNNNFSSIETNKFLFNKIYIYQSLNSNSTFRNQTKSYIDHFINLSISNTTLNTNQIKNCLNLSNIFVYGISNFKINSVNFYLNFIKSMSKKKLFFL